MHESEFEMNRAGAASLAAGRLRRLPQISEPARSGPDCPVARTSTDLPGSYAAQRRFRFFLELLAGAAPLASAVLLALSLHDGELPGPEGSAGRAASRLTPEPRLRSDRIVVFTQHRLEGLGLRPRCDGLACP